MIWPSESTVKLAAAAGPKLTAVAPVNALPAIVTLVPPTTDPDAVEIAVSRGGGTNESLSVSHARYVQYVVLPTVQFGGSTFTAFSVL